MARLKKKKMLIKIILFLKSAGQNKKKKFKKKKTKCSGNKYLVCKALKPFTKRAAIFSQHRAKSEPLGYH